MNFFGVTGQGWLELRALGLAFVLSALVGVEREVRQKSAGLRTYTLVGLSAALFMLVSKYGFSDVLSPGSVVVDPSRVAAQVVSGIGFIGGGVIFMRRDVVRGLTTAASVWLTAALGMACGAGLTVLALAATAAHFVIMFGFPALVRVLPREQRVATRLRVSYRDGRGLLRTILIACTSLRFSIDHVEIEREGVLAEDAAEVLDRVDAEGADAEGVAAEGEAIGRRGVVLRMTVKGRRPISHLIARLSDIEGVMGVGTAGDGAELE